MRILQINHTHYIRGGADVVYFNTAKLLKEKGHHVDYFSTLHPNNRNHNHNDFFVPSIDYRNSSFLQKLFNTHRYLYNKEALKNITRFINELQPDIAHVHLFYGSLTVSILHGLKKMNIPIVHTVHDYRLLCPVKTFLDNKQQVCEACKNHRFLNCIFKKCSDGNVLQSAIVTAEAYYWKYGPDPVKLIDHFIFVSRFIQSKHIEYNQDYANKSSHLYNFQPIDLDNASASIKKGRYLLYYGRLSKEKGINTLLKTLSDENINLVIAGKGPLENQVKNYAQKYKNIQYVGFKSGEDLHDLIRNAFFILVPSEWYENNPMTIIEAFSLGKPVIGSRIGGIPELIQHNTNGFLFQYGNTESLKNSIQKAVNLGEKEYQNFSNAAKEFARLNFDRDTHYNTLINIYRKTVNEYSRATGK